MDDERIQAAVECGVKRAMADFGLTQLEQQVMKEITQDEFFANGLDSVIWVDVFLGGTSSTEGRIIRGTLSSLIKKGYIHIEEYEKGKMVLGLNDKGREYLLELAKTDPEVAAAI